MGKHFGIEDPEILETVPDPSVSTPTKQLHTMQAFGALLSRLCRFYVFPAFFIMV